LIKSICAVAFADGVASEPWMLGKHAIAFVAIPEAATMTRAQLREGLFLWDERWFWSFWCPSCSHHGSFSTWFVFGKQMALGKRFVHRSRYRYCSWLSRCSSNTEPQWWTLATGSVLELVIDLSSAVCWYRKWSRHGRPIRCLGRQMRVFARLFDSDGRKRPTVAV